MNTVMQHRSVRGETTTTFRPYIVALLALSLVAIACAFGISIYFSEDLSKLRGMLLVVVVYLAACAAIYFRYSREALVSGSDAPDSNVDEHLRMLEEAKDYFAGSLRTPDTFRLLASHVRKLITCKGLSLLLFDETRSRLVVIQNDDTSFEKGDSVAADSGAIGSCIEERDVVVDPLSRIAVVPLKRGVEIFGLLVVHFDRRDESVGVSTSLLDAIGERATPLVLASIARERTDSNALTDPSTDLPNERAFHLVLENQVAEAIRKGRSRPLTVLSFDLRDLEEIGEQYGHAASDHALNFVAQCVRDNLRQMDFFARGPASEFLAVMPTASREVSHEIIARIQTSLFGRKIKVSEIDAVEIDLDFGWASFGTDGETSSALLAVARLRKEQAKSGTSGHVVWFPSEVAQ